jgi:pimeloyl-ACP methyl ester carboxylesterase
MSVYTPDAPAPVSQEALDDLKLRLGRFRTAPVAPAPGWSRGVPTSYLAELVDYWKSHYDWRMHEERIRRYPWATAGTTRPIRLIHQHVAPDAPTVVLLHGWPDSILRFEKILPELGDVNVVVPALPGFPFAHPVPEGGMGSVDMASAIAEAVSELGYQRYVLSAGDIGCDVAEAIAAGQRDSVAALHLTDVSQLHYLVNPPSDLSADEEAYVRHGARWQAEEGGYMHEQSTKLQTLAVPLGDSPAGLAAWILEKLHGWTDCDDDVESVFSKDELLTWISAYWFENCIGTSFSPYAEGADMSWARISAPTALTVFPKDLVNAPREFAERFFNVQSWQEFERGGHFAAFERPDDYLLGVRKAIELSR